MADPYNDSGNQPFGTIIALPPALPPQFVGRYPGAPLPQPAPPAAPPAFVPRFDVNSLAVKGAIAGANQPAPGVVQPANAASAPAATPGTGWMGTTIGGVKLPVPAPQDAPAPSLAAARAVMGMPDYKPAASALLDKGEEVVNAPRGTAPTIGADGQWKAPPLVGGVSVPDGNGGWRVVKEGELPPPGAGDGSASPPAGTPGDGDVSGDGYNPGQGTWAAAAMSRQGGIGYIGGRRGGAVMGGGLIDPEGRINDAFDAQSDRANAFINRALDYIQQGGNIFERATRGRAIGNILAATMGPNNVGQVQGQGIDSLNNANAGITQSGNYANANMYGADNQLVGHAMTVGEQAQEFMGTPKPIATEEDYNNFGIKQGARTAYAMPDGSQPKPIVVPKQNGGIKIGQKVTQADGTYNLGNGQRVVVKNGAVAEVQ